MVHREKVQFSDCGIDCTRSRYGAGSLMGRHYHDDTTLVFTLAGSYRHTMRSRVTSFTSNGLLYLPAGETHADDFGPGGAVCFITGIDGTWIGKRFEGAKIDVCEPRISAGGYLPILVRTMYDEFKRPDSLSSLIVEGAFLELMARLFREGKFHHHDMPQWLRVVKALVHDTFREARSLNELSSVAGVNSSHLAREFHRFFGQTVGEYVRKLRVEFVMDKLRSPGRKPLSLTDLALQAGFSSHAHMSSVFKRTTGMTPSQYRRAHGTTTIH